MNATKIGKIALNVLLAVACLFICGDIARKYYLSHERSQLGKSLAPQKGASLAVAGHEWSKHRISLVLVVSSKCHYCTESAPLFQRLVGLAASSGVPSIAISEEREETTRNYLNHLGVAVSDVYSLPTSAAVMQLTPTVLLVDRSGKIEEVWPGVLSPSDERNASEIISRAAARIGGS